MCWRVIATSTSWCWILKSIPTPAASNQKPRRWEPRLNLPPRERRSARRISGLLANMYGHVYVARVAFGAKMVQTAQAFLEAESYDGPSLIIAYSHCIAHGYDMAKGAAQQKLAVESGVWPLYRFDPRRLVKGEAPLNLDYGPPKPKVAEYMRNESRFRMIERADPARFKHFLEEAQAAATRRYAGYQQLAQITLPHEPRTGRRARKWRCERKWRGEAMNLTTTYLGITLPHPLIIGAAAR